MECVQNNKFDLSQESGQAGLRTTIKELILAGRSADMRLVWEVDASGVAQFTFQVGGQGEPCFGS